MSLALQGGFLTTGPPGKSLSSVLVGTGEPTPDALEDSPRDPQSPGGECQAGIFSPSHPGFGILCGVVGRRETRKRWKKGALSGTWALRKEGGGWERVGGWWVSDEA